MDSCRSILSAILAIAGLCQSKQDQKEIIYYKTLLILFYLFRLWSQGLSEEQTLHRKKWEDSASALPASLLVDATHAYILTDCEEGNPVSALGVGGF